MKIRSPTKVTITSITAASGSSTQPSCRLDEPSENQSKLTISRIVQPSLDQDRRAQEANRHSLRTCPNAKIARISENPRPPIAKVADILRCDCFRSAIKPAIAIGNAGISHRFLTIHGNSIGPNFVRSVSKIPSGLWNAAMQLVSRDAPLAIINRSSLHPRHGIEISCLRMAMVSDCQPQSHG